MTGKCESGSIIKAGVYTIYNSAQECCEANYAWDVISCLPSEIRWGVFLPSIPIIFFNIPNIIQLNDEQREAMEDRIREILIPTSDDMNITIEEVIINDSIFGGPTNGLQSLPVTLGIKLSGDEEINVSEVQTAFTSTLQSELYTLANELKGAWGSDVYTKDVILGIGTVQTTLAPTSQPNFSNDVSDSIIQHNDDGEKLDTMSPPIDNTTFDNQVTTNNNNVSTHGDGEKSSLPPWAIVIVAFLFALLCTGLLLVFRRSIDKDDMNGERLPRHNFSSYLDEETSQSPTAKHANFNRSNQSGFNMSMNSFFSFNKSSQSDMNKNSISIFNQSQNTLGSLQVVRNKPQIDPDGKKSFNKSMNFTQSATNIYQGGIDPEPSPNPGQTRVMRTISEKDTERQIIQDEDDESGYDGGKSSVLLKNVVDDEEEDSEEDILDYDSDEDANVLGLLYYDGASSAGESAAKESRRSRRSRRTNKSKSTKSKSTKSRSSKETRSITRKKRKPKELQNVTEERVDGNLSKRGDDVRGSIVVSTHNTSVISGFSDAEEYEKAGQ